MKRRRGKSEAATMHVTRVRGQIRVFGTEKKEEEEMVRENVCECEEDGE